MSATVTYRTVREPNTVLLTLTPEMAERLRGFLQAHHVGGDRTLFDAVYYPLHEVTKEAGVNDLDTALLWPPGWGSDDDDEGFYFDFDYEYEE